MYRLAHDLARARTLLVICGIFWMIFFKVHMAGKNAENCCLTFQAFVKIPIFNGIIPRNIAA